MQQKGVLAITTAFPKRFSGPSRRKSRAQLHINLNVVAESEGVDGPRKHVLKSIAKPLGRKAPVTQVLDATQQ